MKLPVALLETAEREYASAPERARTAKARNAEKSAGELDGSEGVDRRRAMIASAARENLSDAFERYIGTNDLLPLNYLLRGTLQARAVGRVKYVDRRVDKQAAATGFMISPDLMLTNHHVFPVADIVEFQQLTDRATIEFGYELDVQGRSAQSVIYDLDPESFLYTCKELDFALVAVRHTDQTGTRKLSEQGYLVLNGQLGKAGLGDFATIIQHPDGREKQVALRNNEILDMSNPVVLIYQSDTAPGSSGAPVFNNEWQVIALHSAGVAKKKGNDYIDKDGQVIEQVNGTVDGTRIVWVTNRGIRTSAIMAHVRDPNGPVPVHSMVQLLRSPAYTDDRLFSVPPPPDVSSERAGGTPPPAAETPIRPINIQITIGHNGEPSIATLGAVAPRVGVEAVIEQEKKFEDEQDFSDCEGFLDDFMGVRIPMPVPGPALRKKLAFRTGAPSSYTLKYHHISTMQHAVRRVPVVSAINVHGKYRYATLGKGTRVDKWYRDNRIDYDAQLNDEWYAKSGFDKGHMSRREDAEWGSTMSAARRAADMTCSYANAIPQVPGLNRAVFGYHGQWGELETKILEAGAEHESGKSARICVFNGPIFQDDDPVYKNVQVALKCFKIVVWYDGGGALRTTCFRLSQEKLVDGIAFEELRFDEVFKTQQVPLADIESATDLRFDQTLHDADTSAGPTEFDEKALELVLTARRSAP